MEYNSRLSSYGLILNCNILTGKYEAEGGGEKETAWVGEAAQGLSEEITWCAEPG